ncbi:thioesterase domain-containing protein [Clostridium sp. YIM B02569]|uniref:thioesterase II family protein n=1 Tax=Clostridium sp. YIM B02569 TaxID=2911967 RepID=UPI001EE9DB33|nr:thioesterase domain-containing protein [Clostridium sp. YIM B02569]
MEKIKLFCLPYAGGSSSSYYMFKNYLDNNIEICPIELAGRGIRFTDKLNQNFEEVLSDIFEHVKCKIDSTPYAIFGHSMGSWLAYELYNKIDENKLKIPIHLFLSGRGSPLEKNNRIISNKSDEKLKEFLKELGGTDTILLNNDDAMNMFIRIIRSDFKLLENYKYREYPRKIRSKVSIINGSRDNSITKEGLELWKRLIDNHIEYKFYNGSHFYFKKRADLLCDYINKTLLKEH